MTELQSCYFCGATEEVRRIAVVPPRFAPSERDQREVVLCPQCREKLTNVVQPLADQLERARTGEASDDPDAAGDAATDGTAAEDERDQAPESGTDAPVETGGSETGAEGGVTIQPGDSAPEPADTNGGTVDEHEAASDGESSDDGDADTDPEPPGYRKAMRLLSNRDFPLARSEAETLLSGAYDMGPDQVQAVLTHAVEVDGRFTEDGGQLHRA